MTHTKPKLKKIILSTISDCSEEQQKTIDKLADSYGFDMQVSDIKVNRGNLSNSDIADFTKGFNHYNKYEEDEKLDHIVLFKIDKNDSLDNTIEICNNLLKNKQNPIIYFFGSKDDITDESYDKLPKLHSYGIKHIIIHSNCIEDIIISLKNYCYIDFVVNDKRPTPNYWHIIGIPTITTNPLTINLVNYS